MSRVLGHVWCARPLSIAKAQTGIQVFALRYAEKWGMEPRQKRYMMASVDNVARLLAEKCHNWKKRGVGQSSALRHVTINFGWMLARNASCATKPLMGKAKTRAFVRKRATLRFKKPGVCPGLKEDMSSSGCQNIPAHMGESRSMLQSIAS